MQIYLLARCVDDAVHRRHRCDAVVLGDGHEPDALRVAADGVGK